jgi:NAD(P)-dependent dehydrogenase (short-subunit alcohol dehydrogenase family)
MDKELAPHNINVNAVCPGVVRTPLWDPLLQQLSENKSISLDEAWAKFVEGIPFKRPQEPEDIGEAVSFLASDRAGNITASAAPAFWSSRTSNGAARCPISGLGSSLIILVRRNKNVAMQQNPLYEPHE